MSVQPVTMASEVLSEKEAKEKALMERLEKKGAIVATIMRKFITNFHKGRQEMIDEARRIAEEKRLAKLAGKKGKKKKKKDKDEKDQKGKGDKKKGKPKTPVQQAWATFLEDLDEKINKAKRVGLPDMYRGAQQLSPSEQHALANIIASTNKKILPTKNMNVNQFNIKAAVYAAASAFDYTVDRVTLSPNTGAKLLRERGASVDQFLAHGFSEGAAVRNGFSRGEVIASAAHEPRKLRMAGLQVSELVSSQVPAASNDWRGYRTLRSAGYSAGDLVQGGLDHAWNLERAGFPVEDLLDAGLSEAQIRRDGVGLPGSPTPLQPLTSSMLSVCGSSTDTLPMHFGGTQGSPLWRSLMPKPERPDSALKKPSSLHPQSTTRRMIPSALSPNDNSVTQRGSRSGSPLPRDSPSPVPVAAA